MIYLESIKLRCQGKESSWFYLEKLTIERASSSAREVSNDSLQKHTCTKVYFFLYNLYMKSEYLTITSIVLGWVLGIFTPIITRKISEKSERESLKKIIFNDLRELKKRLGPLAFDVYPKYGKLDIGTFEWIKLNSGIDFTTELEKLYSNKYNINQIVNYINIKGIKNGKPTYFKKMNLFATDSHITNLSLLDNDSLEKILEIRFHIEAFNEDIDNFRENLKMTFLPGITQENHKIISDQIHTQNLIIAEKSVFIVNKINEILQDK